MSDEDSTNKVIILNRPYATGEAGLIEKDRQIDGWIKRMMDLFYQIQEMPVLVL